MCVRRKLTEQAKQFVLLNKTEMQNCVFYSEFIFLKYTCIAHCSKMMKGIYIAINHLHT